MMISVHFLRGQVTEKFESNFNNLRMCHMAMSSTDNFPRKLTRGPRPHKHRPLAGRKPFNVDGIVEARKRNQAENMDLDSLQRPETMRELTK
jgi:hypothetical protein